MIDTGCQVTILSTTVFERMCIVDPAVRSELRPCRRQLVSADSSPLIVQGQLELAIVFPGLCCDMLFVVANIGSDGLLGTEALQSYLPHQCDLRTGQLWADGWSTLQLHQQRLTPELDGFLMTSVVIPPDSEIVVKFSVSGIRPHGCTLVEPARGLMEEYGVVVGHMLVDASSGSGSVLIVNPNAEVVVLPGCTRIGKLVPVAAISVAMEDLGLPTDGPAALPEYLEEIVGGSHPSLGDAGRQLLRDLLFRYRHVFPAPGEPVTSRTTAVQHDIITADARPVRCTQIGCGTRSVDDYCACAQLQNSHLAGWSKIGCSGWQIPEGGRVLPFELRHSMGTTGHSDVSGCVYYGVGIAVFSSGIVSAKHLTGRRLMFMI